MLACLLLALLLGLSDKNALRLMWVPLLVLSYYFVLEIYLYVMFSEHPTGISLLVLLVASAFYFALFLQIRRNSRLLRNG